MNTSPMVKSQLDYAYFQMKRAGKRGHGVIAENRAVFLQELLSGKKKGRTSAKADHLFRARQHPGVRSFSRSPESLRVF